MESRYCGAIITSRVTDAESIRIQDRIKNVELSSLSPLILTTSSGVGPSVYKRLASLLSYKVVNTIQGLLFIPYSV